MAHKKHMSMKCVSVKSDDDSDAQRVIEIDVPLEKEAKTSYQTRRVPQKIIGHVATRHSERKS